jgi:hypothetical protein
MSPTRYQAALPRERIIPKNSADYLRTGDAPHFVERSQMLPRHYNLHSPPPKLDDAEEAAFIKELIAPAPNDRTELLTHV